MAGTFDHWVKGEHDPRVPVVTYSSMFYSLIRKLDARALLLTEPDRLPESQDERITFVRTPHERPNGRWRWWWASYRFSRTVLRAIKAYDPHLVIAGTDTPSWVVPGLAPNIKVVVSAHNTFWPMGRRGTSLKAKLREFIIRRAWRRVASAVCTSQECARQIEALVGKPERLFVQLPQVQPQNIREIGESEGLKSLFYLGRIEENKGVFDLLEAFETLAADHADLTLDFAGDGSADGLLRTRIEASPFCDRIRFYGRLSAQEVHEKLAVVDALACPTRSSFDEGLGMVVVEAASHGVPCILSSVVPAKDHMGDSCEEFPADDTDALLEAIRKYVIDPNAFAGLRRKIAKKSEMYQDATRSWGSQLYRAMIS